MACGPNLAPGRCEVPPSNGAPMMRMSVPAHEAGSARSAGGTPRNVASGPYMLPSRAMTTSPSVRAGCCSAAGPGVPAQGERPHHAEQYDANPGSSRFPKGPRWGTQGLGPGLAEVGAGRQVRHDVSLVTRWSAAGLTENVISNGLLLAR